MADARALLAAARQSRRITHPHLLHSKAGALTCTLWPGHLKSQNHKKNVLKLQESRPKQQPLKRKHNDVEDTEDEASNVDVESRKKPRSASTSRNESEERPQPLTDRNIQPLKDTVVAAPTAAKVVKFADELQVREIPTDSTPSAITIEPPIAAVDEDEWAAFERDLAPLAQPDYALVTIEAAPVAVVQAQQNNSTDVESKEDERQAEQEDAARRLEEEFEVMEQIEDRMKRLRERREALRKIDSSIPTENTGSPATQVNSEPAEPPKSDPLPEDDDDSDVDDWYG
ncbi:hypothetical protein LTR66_015178 [Elasticomyces elasticus]|nr:hypothetical protein LTR66_015178 [Elasticomyces elasticus]